MRHQVNCLGNLLPRTLSLRAKNVRKSKNILLPALQQLPQPSVLSIRQAPTVKTATMTAPTACEALYLTHHVRHAAPHRDSLVTLSLQYNVPVATLQRHNRLPLGANHRRLHGIDILAIPTTAVTEAGTRRTVSLSPSPPALDPEEERQLKIRRVVAACNGTDRDTAVRYLQGNEWNFVDAVRQYWTDEMWEWTHLSTPWDSAYAAEKWRLKYGGGGEKARKGVWRWLKEKLRK